MRIIFLVLLLFGQSALADWTFEKSEVSFVAIGNPGFLRINGEGANLEGDVKGDLNSFHADLKVDLRKLKTGLSLRDQHMHGKYLETNKFPYAELEIKTLLPIELGKEFDFGGRLKIKDKVNLIKGKATFDGKKLKAGFTLELADYPVGVPNWMGISVADSVAVEVNAVAK